VEGGEGVGRVTKPGLEIPVGQAAINPVPLKMIEDSVREVTGNRGIGVVISVTGGEELAKRTLNSRLGITGGISVLGTTGIVIPYSVDAYQASISKALDIAVACGCRRTVLSTGRRSEKYAQKEFDLPEESFVQAGDFIGYSLEECARRAFDEAIVWGMTGKISKLADGHLYTNISDSQINIDFLVDIAAGCGVPEERLAPLRPAVTANQLRRLLPPEYVRIFSDTLCRLASERCREHIGGRCRISCIMSDYDGTVLGRYDD
jgi:cobalt-precorrin-5B (C1)-methyltransferase